jgi:Fic family protein
MRIIKRQKGKKDYFYIQHSFRKKNKVVTKEKYLGAQIPKNIDEIESKFASELKADLYAKLEKIKKDFQLEWKRLPKSVKEKEKERFSINFTYNTNAIEGSTITLQEAREIIHDKIAPNRPLRDIKETELHSNIFLEMLDKKEKITSKLFLRWHQEIFGESKPDIAGVFRDYLVRVGEYLAPDWQDVEKLMKKFVKFASTSEMNVVEFAARARAFNKGEEGFVDYFLRRYLAVYKKRLN